MKLVEHYIMRGTRRLVLIIVGFLIFIFASYSAQRYLTEAANGTLALDVVLDIVFYKVLIALEMLLYQQNPVTGGLIFIDRLSNVTVGAGMVHEPVSQATAAPSEFSAFELELNALVRRHFPHWGARDLLGDK